MNIKIKINAFTDTVQSVIFINNKQQYHRENDKPACLQLIAISYYINGKLHRNNGPAVIWKTGGEFFWKRGKYLGEEGKKPK